MLNLTATLLSDQPSSSNVTTLTFSARDKCGIFFRRRLHQHDSFPGDYPYFNNNLNHIYSRKMCCSDFIDRNRTMPAKKFWPSLSVNSKKKICNPYFIVFMITILIINVIFWVVNFKTQNYFVFSTIQNVYLRLSMYDCSNFVY
jgi:hypothetical protein